LFLWVGSDPPGKFVKLSRQNSAGLRSELRSRLATVVGGHALVPPGMLLLLLRPSDVLKKTGNQILLKVSELPGTSPDTAIQNSAPSLPAGYSIFIETSEGSFSAVSRASFSNNLFEKLIRLK